MENVFPAIIFSIVTFFSGVIPQATFIEGAVGQPRSIDPLKATTNQVDRDLISLIFQGLVKYDRNDSPVGVLADAWEVSEDERDYTFHLRRNVHWHDGKVFTAEDVIYTVSQSNQFKEIQVDRLDDYTVRFRLKEPLSSFLEILTLGMIPAHLQNKPVALWPVGTGPFRVIKIKKSDKIEEMTLQGERRRLAFRFYDSYNDLMAAAKLGEVDGYLLSEEAPRDNWPSFNYFSAPMQNRYYALLFNLSSNLALDNKELRQDLVRNLPKQKIIKNALNDFGSVIDGPVDGTWTENPNYNKLEYEPMNKKKYETTIVLTVPNKPLNLKLAELIKNEWATIGIDLELEIVETETMYDQILKPRKYQAVLLGQEVTHDPDRYTLWHSSQVDPPGINLTGIKQVRIDRSLEEGRKISDREKRKEYYYHFQEVLAEEAPAIFLYRPVLIYGVRRGIKGVDLKGLFSPSDRFNDFNQWQF